MSSWLSAVHRSAPALPLKQPLPKTQPLLNKIYRK